MGLAIAEQASSAQRDVAVRVVDSDVHPAPLPTELFQYIPEPHRSTFWKQRRSGQPSVYDAPDYGHTRAMRVDAFPESGGFPGSDPELAFQQLIIEAGCDLGILEPISPAERLPEYTQSLHVATNHWLVNPWLDGKTNWHERWRGS